MHIFHSITEIIGNTPLLQLLSYTQCVPCKANIYVKLECMNPAGSAKDRVALSLIENAEKDGSLLPHGTIIEPTSGNTGIGLAAIGTAKGYKVILTMPESMSEERRKLLQAYGAELVLTPASEGMAGSIKKAEEIQANTPHSIIASQFDNPHNPEAHYQTTGPEIYNALDGNVDIFVAGIGTGGTISGVGRYLKEKNPSIQIVGVEPERSPLITKGISGPHGLQGIGANFVPDNFDASIVDEVLTVSDEDAYKAAQTLVACEGLLCGITSGAALHAATLLAQRKENNGKNIVALLPDTGTRYLSTKLFSKE